MVQTTKGILPHPNLFCRCLIYSPAIIMTLVFLAYYTSCYIFYWGRLIAEYDEWTFLPDFVDEDHAFYVDVNTNNGYRGSMLSKVTISPPKRQPHRLNKVETGPEIKPRNNSQFSNPFPSRLLDLPFEYLLQPTPDICLKSRKSGPQAQEQRKLLVILICSQEDNFKPRQVIREQFGKFLDLPRNRWMWSIYPVFVISNTPNRTQGSKLLKKEARLMKDILVGNLSLELEAKEPVYTKLMGFKWLLNNCNQADFVVTAMDNISLDVGQLVNLVSGQVDQNPGSDPKNSNLLLCKTVKPNSGSSIDPNIHADYCSPELVVMSLDLVKKFYLGTQGTYKFYPKFWEESGSPWITGVLRMKLGVVALPMDNLVTNLVLKANL